MWFGLLILLLIVYLGITWRSLIEASAPALSCYQTSAGLHSFSSLNCFRPAVYVGDKLTIQLQLFSQPFPHRENGDLNAYRWISIDTCRIDLVVPATRNLPKLVTGAGSNNDDNVIKADIPQQCEIMLPASSRHRSTIQSEVHPLKARFIVFETTTTGKTDSAADYINQKRYRTNVIGIVAPFYLTRVLERKPKPTTKFLLNSETRSSLSNQNSYYIDTNRSIAERKDSNHSNKYHYLNSTMWIPYLKFGRSPLRIRFVAEDRDYAVLKRADGFSLKALNSSFYAPMLYVEELSLQQGAQVELAPFEDSKPSVKIQIKFSSISPMVDTLYRQVQAIFEIIEDKMILGAEFDELKYFLQEENLYRFMLTNLISTVHVWFDYLAFRDEVKFYRGRKKLNGVSSSTVIARMVCSLVILLYLIDGGATSWVVLFSVFSSFIVETWKACKLLQLNITSKFPFMKIREQTSNEELKTKEYDRIACRILSMVLYPVLICWSIYALKTFRYRSLYSWFISSMANGVYTFGFISMCPQLYVNYRLKSVAHLPWKVFLYKVFNTFVDDAFAWLIEMPLKHRLMTLRDDVVFSIFLVQVYLYQVDKTRNNEFGYSYPDDGGGDDDDGKRSRREITLGDYSRNAYITGSNESTTQVGKRKVE